MKEASVEQAVRRITQELGGVCWKWVSPGRIGVPDRICIFPGGRVVFVELKRPDLKDGRSPQQRKVAGILQRLGCEVWLINSGAAFQAQLIAAGIKENDMF